MPSKDMSTWQTAGTWLLVATSAFAGYFVRLADRIRNRKVRGLFLETVDAAVCLVLALIARAVTLHLELDDNLAWAVCVIVAHKGTRILFVVENLAIKSLEKEVK